MLADSFRQQAVQHYPPGMRAVQHHPKPEQAVQHCWGCHGAIAAAGVTAGCGGGALTGITARCGGGALTGIAARCGGGAFQGCALQGVKGMLGMGARLQSLAPLQSWGGQAFR